MSNLSVKAGRVASMVATSALAAAGVIAMTGTAANATTIYNVGCWTTVTRTTQFYANCDPDHAEWVCPGYVLNGVKHEYRATKYIRSIYGYDGVADDTDTAVWSISALPGLPAGAYRTTVFCTI